MFSARKRLIHTVRYRSAKFHNSNSRFIRCSAHRTLGSVDCSNTRPLNTSLVHSNFDRTASAVWARPLDCRATPKFLDNLDVQTHWHPTHSALRGVRPTARPSTRPIARPFGRPFARVSMHNGSAEPTSCQLAVFDVGCMSSLSSFQSCSVLVGNCGF